MGNDASARRQVFACPDLAWRDAEAATEQPGEVHWIIEAAAERYIANSLAFIGVAREKRVCVPQASFPYVISHCHAMRGEQAIEVGT